MHGAGKLYGVGPRQVSRADTLWRKLFSVKGESPEPMPVVPVLGEPIEAQYLNGWRTYMDSIGVTGDATHQGQILIQFPTAGAENMLAVIERLEVFYTPATIGNPIKLGWNAAGIVAGNAGKMRDSRVGLSNTGQLRNQAFAASAALYASAIDVYPVNLTAAVSVHQPILFPGEHIVLATGAVLVVASAANAETIQVRYTWKERVMEPAERTAS